MADYSLLALLAQRMADGLVALRSGYLPAGGVVVCWRYNPAVVWPVTIFLAATADYYTVK